MVQANMVRPLPSTISSTSSIIQGKRRSRRGGASAWLWSLCAFLLILCILLFTALVLVAKRAARETHPVHGHNYYDINGNWLSSRNESLLAEEPAFGDKNKSVIVLVNQFNTKSRGDEGVAVSPGESNLRAIC